MKFRLFLLILLATGIHSYAQKKIDAVYLKNSSVIKGNLIEHSDSLVKIETCCGSIFAFQTGEIQEIKKEEYKSAKALKSNGYYNLTSLGVLTGTGSNEKEAPLSLMMEHLYRLNNYTAFGTIIGLETLNEAVLPLGINLKGLLPLSNGGASYIGISGGYSFSLEKPSSYYTITKAKGGIFINPEIGFIVSSSGNGSFFMAIGYRYNVLNYERDDFYYSETVERKQIYNRISIKIGICFH
jgi:hypothetical protein